jgi:hypothetical protein
VGKRKYTDEQLIAALPEARNMRQLLTALGLAPRGENYENVWRHIAALGLDCSHLRQRSTYEHRSRLGSCTDLDIEEAVRRSRSLAQVLVALGLRPGSGQELLKRRIHDLGLDTSHFLGQAWRAGSRIPVVPARPLEEVLVIGRFVSSHDLRARLFREGLKEPRCEMCRRTRWNGRPIPLELDHINGRRDDNTLANLRVLCPNCHAQTPTYRGRNIGSTDLVS